MIRLITAIAAIAFLFSAGIASAADTKGAIQSINGNTRMVTIAGVEHYFPQNVDLTGLTAGMVVTLTHALENGRNQVSKVAK